MQVDITSSPPCADKNAEFEVSGQQDPFSSRNNGLIGPGVIRPLGCEARSKEAGSERRGRGKGRERMGKRRWAGGRKRGVSGRVRSGRGEVGGAME